MLTDTDRLFMGSTRIWVKDKILEFEEDIKNGKEIDVEMLQKLFTSTKKIIEELEEVADENRKNLNTLQRIHMFLEDELGKGLKWE